VPFDRQPVLKGDLVELRPLLAEDHEALYAVASDPLIWAQHPDKNRHEKEGFKAFFQESLESGGALLAMDAKSKRAIGSSRFHGYDEERKEIEIGWTFLARSYWGGRYNGEMKDLMLQHAYRFVDRVIFLVGTENTRSQRAVEKIGGVRVGSRPDAGGRDSYIYELTAPPKRQMMQGQSATGRLRTALAHERSFDRAPRVRGGDIVRRVRDDEKNPGWFLGVAPGGVEGYFPSRWFEADPDGAIARALRDYDAMELTIEANVEVECLAEESGWLLVRTDDGRQGWIPVDCMPKRRQTR
jgi:RimJ/RimL family protein N-acetyltransferase